MSADLPPGSLPWLHDLARWAGITGYFIGLAITSPHRDYWIGLIGIGIAAVLHGLNDWNPINSHPAWVVVTLLSVLLFLGYARAGAWLPEQAMAAPDGMAVPPEHAQAYPSAQPSRRRREDHPPDRRAEEHAEHDPGRRRVVRARREPEPGENRREGEDGWRVGERQAECGEECGR